MKIIIYSNNGLEYCKEELEKIFPKMTIENSNDEEYPFGQKIEEKIDCLETLNDILAINGCAFLWKETLKTETDFFIDLTESPMG